MLKNVDMHNAFDTSAAGPSSGGNNTIGKDAATGKEAGKDCISEVVFAPDDVAEMQFSFFFAPADVAEMPVSEVSMPDDVAEIESVSGSPA